MKGKFIASLLWGGLVLSLLALLTVFAQPAVADRPPSPHALVAPVTESILQGHDDQGETEHTADRAPAGLQETLTFYADADATVRSTQPNTNFGSEHALELSYIQIDLPAEEVVLLRFDLSALPADAVIDSAVMDLYLAYTAGDNPKSLAAYYVTGAWSESTVTWNTFPTAETWGIVSSVDNVTGRYKSWTITSWASYWHSHPAENRGVYLRRLTSETTYFERTFESRDHNERRPRLVVTYHLPATATPTATATTHQQQRARPRRLPRPPFRRRQPRRRRRPRQLQAGRP